jgi:hypothetical protein
MHHFAMSTKVGEHVSCAQRAESEGSRYSTVTDLARFLG